MMILVAVDGSELALDAVRHALHLKRNGDISVHLVRLWISAPPTAVYM